MHEFRQFGIVVLIVVWFIRINFKERVQIESVSKNASIRSEIVSIDIWEILRIELV